MPIKSHGDRKPIPGVLASVLPEQDAQGRQAHQQHGDQEGVLAPPEVAQPPEHERAERPDREARREGQKCDDEAAVRIERREDVRGDEADQRAVQIEVVPLEDGADGRRGDDERVLAVDTMVRLGARAGAAGHDPLPLPHSPAALAVG
jgi:hypothetical protein